jgi:hypothetical protein
MTTAHKTPAKAQREVENNKRGSYVATMTQARSHMNGFSRVFSKIIHYRPIELLSDVLGATIARPMAILCGGIVAFTISVLTYAVAKYYGYSLSGTETLAGFVLGWCIGIIIDYTHLLIRGKRSS